MIFCLSCQTYIIVRPPPAKNNHPLNLQIQLVPPRQRDSASRSATSVSQRQSGEYTSVSVEAQALSSSPSPTISAFGLPSPGANHPPSHDLVRVTSIRSNHSDRSAGFYASTLNASSVNSFTSTASSSSTAAPRRIVPLYNLSAHNVMTNYIADAGTDTKVAKFQRRALDIIRVGIWEPVEVWSSYARRVSHTSSTALPEDPIHDLERYTTLLSGGNVLSTDLFVRDAPPSAHLPVPGTPEAGKRSPLEKSPSPHYKDLPPSPMPPPSANAAKKFFGKVFKKNKNGETSSDTSPDPSSGNFFRIKRSSSHMGPIPSPMSPQPSASGRAVQGRKRSGSHEIILQPPILGLQAVLHSSHSAHPTGRPTSYIWCLRKWAKEKQLNPESLLKGLAAGLQGLNLNLSDEKKSGKDPNVIDTSLAGDIEVRFEWSRGKGASSKGRERQGTLNLKGPSNPVLSSLIGSETGLLPSPTEENGMKDVETLSSIHSNHSGGSFQSNMVQRSPKRAPAHLSTGGLGVGPARYGDNEASTPSPYQQRSPIISGDDHAAVTDGDDGADSDPEDSETPWTCTLHIYPSHLSPLTEREMKERVLLQTASDFHALPTDGRIRIKLASLIPTPHHPKILGQFKLPFPLPDVAITPNTSSSLSYLQSASSQNPNCPIPIALQRYQSGIGARFLPRTVAPDGSILRAANREGQVDMGAEVLLTAEDIKDVVSSTGLWLCVREGFGGLGRTKRKGDGWHIRA